jgi:hypothetical protein
MISNAAGTVSKQQQAAVNEVERTLAQIQERIPVVGGVKFGLDGEWSQARILLVQLQNIHGNGLDQFRDVATQVILGPSQFKSGDIIYPYERAKH